MLDFIELLCHGRTIDGAVKMLKHWATSADKHINLMYEEVEGPHESFGRAVPARKTLYVWKDEPGNEEFKNDWKESFDIGTEVLEDKAMTFAMAGSEKLVMFLLKARNPGRYANFGALGGGTFQVTFSPSDADL